MNEGIHLVTGGSGFVGRALVDHLLSLKCKVRVLDTRSKPEGLSVDWVQTEITNPSAVGRALTGVSCVHHLAAAVPLIRDPSEHWRVNFNGTQCLLDAIDGKSDIHINYVSSSAVYNPHMFKGVADETSPVSPFESYGQSKLAAEVVLLERKLACKNVSVTIIRPRTVIGPGRGGLFDLLFRWIRNDSPVYYLGDGKNQIQFLHVGDLVKALDSAWRSRVSGIFVLGCPEVQPIGELLSKLILESGSQSRLLFIPHKVFSPLISLSCKLKLLPFSPWHLETAHLDFVFSNTKFDKCFGWSPSVSNYDSIRSAFNDSNNRLHYETESHLTPHTGRIKSKLIDSIWKQN